MLLKLKQQVSLKNVISSFQVSISALGSNCSKTQSTCLTLYMRVSLAELAEPMTCIKLSHITTGRVMTLHTPAGFTAQNVPTRARCTPDIISDTFQPQNMRSPATSEMVAAARAHGSCHIRKANINCWASLEKHHDT